MTNIKALKEIISLDKVKHFDGDFNNAVDWLANFLDKHNVVAIQGLEFPSWEEFEKIKEITKNNYSISCSTYFTRSPRICCVCDRFEIEEQDCDEFNFSKAGYRKACEWIRKKILEPIKDLAKGD